jgi:hypothetical protein
LIPGVVALPQFRGIRVFAVRLRICSFQGEKQ